MRHCPSCGAPNPPLRSVCFDCGAPMYGNAEQPPREPGKATAFLIAAPAVVWLALTRYPRHLVGAVVVLCAAWWVVKPDVLLHLGSGEVSGWATLDLQTWSHRRHGSVVQRESGTLT